MNQKWGWAVLLKFVEDGGKRRWISTDHIVNVQEYDDSVVVDFIGGYNLNLKGEVKAQFLGWLSKPENSYNLTPDDQEAEWQGYVARGGELDLARWKHLYAAYSRLCEAEDATQSELKRLAALESQLLI